MIAALPESTLVDERTMERLAAHHIMDIELPIGSKRGKHAKDRLSRLARAIVSEAYGDQPEFEENRERESVIERLDTLAADITAMANALRRGAEMAAHIRIIVEVSGGVVQAVYANHSADCVAVDVLDWDNYNDGDESEENRAAYTALEMETKSAALIEVY